MEGRQRMINLSCNFTGPFPYTASVRNSTGQHRCGAVLIATDTVLTAASCVHCRNGSDDHISEIFLGGFNRDNPIERRSPALTIIHENYTGDPVDGNDIALIKLNQSTCLRPVPNIGRQTAAGEQYMLLGFGRASSNSTLSSSLRGANVTNFDIQQCNEIFGAETPLDEKKVCTRNLDCNCASSCEGDEGGPIVLRETVLRFEDTLIALASYSNGDCGVNGSFSVHTDIQEYENWIMRQRQSKKFLSA
eukprot:g7952.t1